jgi:hypothetical protein
MAAGPAMQYWVVRRHDRHVKEPLGANLIFISSLPR